MLQLPDHITIKTSVPFVVGAYIGIWLIATVYLNVLDSQINKLKRELRLLAEKPSESRSIFSAIIWLTFAVVGVGIAIFAFTYPSSSDQSLRAAIPLSVYLYIAIWTLSFGYLLNIGVRLFKLYDEMQMLNSTITEKSDN